MVITELVEVFIELGNFGLDVVGYVFVDIFVAKVLFDTLFDVVFAEHEYWSRVLVCLDDDDFFVLGEETEGCALQAEDVCSWVFVEFGLLSN